MEIKKKNYGIERECLGINDVSNKYGVALNKSCWNDVKEQNQNEHKNK